MQLHKGDTIEVPSNKGDRHGTVRRVLDDDPLRIEVDWDDGHTSVRTSRRQHQDHQTCLLTAQPTTLLPRPPSHGRSRGCPCRPTS